VAAVGEGVDPATVEQAALQAGYPTGPLQLLDELTLTLPRKIRQETKAAAQTEGKTWVPHRAEAVIDAMIDAEGRTGRSGGAGFYDYDATGRRTRLWPGLRTRFGSGAAPVPIEDLQQREDFTARGRREGGAGRSAAMQTLQERMLFAEAIDAVRCLDDGVLTSVADANVGSLQGIGFPAWTGGVLQYINGYRGGPAGFVERARELAASYGPQFEPPASLVSMASTGGRYR
jgi:3-hydroxyacyl-CoA dehydrogenase/enoyl-CoA hydratase/3-hydroxybutyryl-CoA epimerase